MKPASVLAVAGLAALSAPALSQDSPTERGGEPAVRRSVIEDDGSRIEELRVRGQAQRIVVTPKGGTGRPYEILTPNASRDPADPASPARSAVGQRVWHVLSF